MANFSKQTLSRVGRLLNFGKKPGEKTPTDMAKLAEWTGVGRKALYNWTLPDDHAQYRAMPPLAKRLVTLLAYFAMTGQLNNARLKDMENLELALNDDVNGQKLIRRVSAILGKGAPKTEGAEASEATAEGEANEDEDVESAAA